MPTAIVRLSDDANQVINIVKAKYALKDKSEAINQLAMEYGQELLEPELRPEYIKKIKIIEKEKTIPIKNVDEYFDSFKR
jgi:hypothetical protein